MENRYIKNKHFEDIMTERFMDYKKIFDHFERLSSKAVMYSSGSNLAIIYVDTIVFLKLDGIITLNTNGWTTSTSQKWINHGFRIISKPARMFRKDWEWYIKTDNETIDYVDDMILKMTLKV